jgi:hypothetical protein
MQHSQKKLIWRKSAGYDRLGIIFVCLLTLHQYSRLIYGTCNIQNIMNCQFNSFVSNVFIFEKKTPNIYIDQKVLQLNKASFWKNLIFLSFLPLKTLYFITTNGDKSYLLTLPLCAGVSCIRALKIVINRCANRSRTSFDAEENFLFRSNVQWIHLGLSCYGLFGTKADQSII